MPPKRKAGARKATPKKKKEATPAPPEQVEAAEAAEASVVGTTKTVDEVVVEEEPGEDVAPATTADTVEANHTEEVAGAEGAQVNAPASSTVLPFEEQAVSEEEPVAEGEVMGEEAKRQVRARRFGLETDEIDKRELRAQRFGVPLHMSEEEKRALRASRFGGAPTQSLDSANRLGLPVRGTAAGQAVLDVSTKLQARALRFGLVNEEEAEKKRARAKRFGLPTQ